MNVIDFGRSFIGCKAPDNSVHFWIESRMQMIDEQAGRTEDFYQCGSCKSEHTFAPTDLFHDPNYDFTPIFGTNSGVIFRSHAEAGEGYREIRSESADQLWGGQNYHVVEKPGRPLTSFDDIRDAVRKFEPIVAQTEIANDRTGMRATILYPIKTLNIREADSIYQVDTGPIAFADLSQRQDKLVEHIWLAFVAFNVDHFADFVIEAPTPIIQDGREVARAQHYSKIVSLPAKNRLFAVEVAESLYVGGLPPNYVPQ